jgi:predicted Zn-dependent peptidase
LFHTELEAVYEEKNISLDSDGDKVFEELFSGLFPNHTYGTQTTIGTIEHLKNPSLKKIREFYKTWYVPNNMVIVMSGDFSYDQAIELIEKHFGSLESRTVPEFKSDPIPVLKNPITKTVKGPESEYITIGYRLPAPKGKERIIMDLTDKLLQNGKSGLFDINLIKKQQLLNADAGIFTLHDYSVLFMSGQPQSGQNLKQLEKLILDQIDSLKSGKFSQADLDAIILNESVNQMKQLEENSSHAFRLLDAFIKEIPWNEVLEQINLMKQITKEDIVKFASTYFKNDYTVVYKVQEEERQMDKIQKPEITPVEVNRNAVSRFAKNILDNEYTAVKPVFIDYNKDFSRSSLNSEVDILHTKNKKNSLFRLNYVYEFGRLSNLKLPFAINLLQFLGTDKFSAEEISKQFYAIGCTFSVYAGDDQTYVSLSGPQERFERAVSTLEYLLNNAIPASKPLKVLVTDEIQNRLDAKTDKYAIRSALSSYTRYGEDNPVNYVLSNKKLKKLKAADLVSELKQLKTYPHKILYYGPEDTLQVNKVIRKYHLLPEKMNSKPEAKKFIYRSDTTTEVFFTHYDMVQAEIGWSASSGTYSAELAPGIALFNEYFGGGMSSVVFQTIRESKALAYSSYAFFSTPSDKTKPYNSGAYVGTQADKIDSAITAMNNLLLKMPQSELLFKASQSAIISRIESDRITGNSIMFNYLNSLRFGLNEDIRKLIYEKVPEMTLSDVADFHNKFMSNQQFDMFVLASENKVSKNQLSKYGLVREVTIKQLFGY